MRTLLFIFCLITHITFGQWKYVSQNEIMKSSKPNGLRTICSDISANQDTITIFGTESDTLIAFFKEGTERYFAGNKTFMLKCHADGRKIAFKLFPFKSKFNGFIRKDLKHAILASETDLADTIRILDLNGNAVSNIINTEGGNKSFRIDASGNLYTFSRRENTFYMLKHNSSYQPVLKIYNIVKQGINSNYLDLREIEMLEDEKSILVYGSYRGNVDLDPGANQRILFTAAKDSRNIFVAKYSYDGVLLWANSFGGSKLEEVAYMGFKNGQYIHSFDTQSDTVFVNETRNRLILPAQSANSNAHIFYPINQDGTIDSTKIKYVFSEQDFNISRFNGSAFQFTEEIYQRFESSRNAFYLSTIHGPGQPLKFFPGNSTLVSNDSIQTSSSFDYNGNLQLLESSNKPFSLEEVYFPLYLNAVEKLNPTSKIGYEGKISIYWLNLENKNIILHYERTSSPLGDMNGYIGNSNYQLFPNPASQTVKLSSNDLQDADLMKIYSLSGAFVSEFRLPENDEIDVSSLHKGIYICKIYREDKCLIINKLVIE